MSFFFVAHVEPLPKHTPQLSTAVRKAAPVRRQHRLQADALAALRRRQEQAIELRLDRLRARFVQAERLLATLKLSEQAILERGYALVLDSAGTVVKRAAEITLGQALELRFADGAAHAVAGEGSRPAAPRKAVAPNSKEPGSQGSLF